VVLKRAGDVNVIFVGKDNSLYTIRGLNTLFTLTGSGEVKGRSPLGIFTRIKG